MRGACDSQLLPQNSPIAVPGRSACQANKWPAPTSCSVGVVDRRALRADSFCPWRYAHPEQSMLTPQGTAHDVSAAPCSIVSHAAVPPHDSTAQITSLPLPTLPPASTASSFLYANPWLCAACRRSPTANHHHILAAPEMTKSYSNIPSSASRGCVQLPLGTPHAASSTRCLLPSQSCTNSTVETDSSHRTILSQCQHFSSSPLHSYDARKACSQ